MSTIFWRFSKRNIRIHMLRLSLAMLGIIIGVVAIASMGILGNTIVQEVSSSLSSVGDSVIVTPYACGGGGFGHGGGGSLANLYLTNQNFQQIKRLGCTECGHTRHVDIRAHESRGGQRRHRGEHLRAPAG